MKKIAIVYHSGYGHTKAIAERVKIGVEKISGVECSIFKAEQFPDSKSEMLKELEKMDAIIFGCPTYMGSASAGMKQFMEATSGIWFNQGWKNKIAAGFTVSGTYSGGKEDTLVQLMKFAGQHSMIWVNQGIMPTGKENGDLNRLGAWSGLMAQADNGPADVTPPEGDRKTAESFGARVAEFCKKIQ